MLVSFHFSGLDVFENYSDIHAGIIGRILIAYVVMGDNGASRSGEDVAGA